MKKGSSTRVHYSKASDEERVRRNWNKACGLFERGEYSVAVIRCGTCAELAVNLGIREELVKKRNLPDKFVDRLLRDANGIRKKYHGIFLPIMAESDKYDLLKKLWKDMIVKINAERNRVVHMGEFRKKRIAYEVMQGTREVLEGILKCYGYGAKLRAVREN